MKTTKNILLKKNWKHLIDFLAKVVFLILLIHLGYFYSNAQSQDSVQLESATSCEENEARLDQLLVLFGKERDPENVLIIIAHLGSGENSLEINQLRLHNAKEYLLGKSFSSNGSRIIITQGEKIIGLGRIEFYFGGKKVESLLIKKNRNLCVDCCENNKIKPYRSAKKNPKL
jgi:hypothetical protein